MPTFQVLKSYAVPKPEGGYYSKGVVVDLDENSAATCKDSLIPYTINDGAAGPETKLGYTQSQIDAIVEDAVTSAVAKARAEWEAELAAAQDPKAIRLKALSAMKLDDLRAIANDTEIENMHDLKKAELVTAIMEVEFPVAPAS